MTLPMTLTDYTHLEFEPNGKVLTVYLNRPDRYNAINGALHTDIARFLASMVHNTDYNAIVITGRGKAFCAGGDLSWFTNMTDSELDRLFLEGRSIIMNLLELEIPIISAINGPAAGFGATLALFCDIIYAADTAMISDPHVSVGVVAGDGGASIWPWLVGIARAKEFLMTGDALTADRAYAIGLVNHVVSAADLLSTAQACAHRLAQGAQQAIRGTKKSLNQILRDTVNLNFETALALEKACFNSPDNKEAIKAFTERRKPTFSA